MSADTPPLRLVWMDPAELPANGQNWRTHPPAQTQALSAALDRVGWAGALLFNEATNRLIDGHARKELYEGKGKVPVLIGSWTEEQERLILATLDPIAGMAQADPAKLSALLAGCRESMPSPTEGDVPAQALQSLLAGLAGKHGITNGTAAGGAVPTAPETFPEFGEDVRTEYQCPRCSYAWSGKPK